MRNVTLICLYTLCLIAVSASALGQVPSKPDFGKKLDNYLEQVMETFEIPGLSVAVTKNDEVVYLRALGVRDLQTKAPLKTDDTFHFASVSKPFVATAIMQLVEAGKVKLDERVTTYLPYFKLKDVRYKQITIRQMLNHTSGMPDVIDYQWDKPQYDDGAAERYVRSLQGESLLWAPGSRFRYSNIAFDTLGDVIAKCSGMPFEAYVKKNILNPLEMKNSSFLLQEIPVERRTTGHVWRLKTVVSDVYPYNRRHAPSSTLNSSVEEMANWAIANLNHGELNGSRILNADSYDELFRKSAEVEGRSGIGLSWFLESHRGLNTIGHAGGDVGFSSYLAIIPEKKLGIVIVSNYARSPIEGIYRIVADTVLGFEPEMPKASIASAVAEALTNQGIAAAKKSYGQLKKNETNKYQFGPAELNGLGYVLLRENRSKDALEVFKFNVELFPNTANVFDSLGEAYALTGNPKPAIESYKKALELDPTLASARSMLKKLQSKSDSDKQD